MPLRCPSCGQPKAVSKKTAPDKSQERVDYDANEETEETHEAYETDDIDELDEYDDRLPPKNPFAVFPFSYAADLTNRRTRRYQCKNCGEDFLTHEYYVPKKLKLLVRRGQAHGFRVEPFCFDKVLDSMRMASSGSLDDRSLWSMASQVLILLTSEIFSYEACQIDDENERRVPLVTTEQVGEATMLALLQNHQIAAWLRYALIFYRMSEERSFVAAIEALSTRYSEHLARLAKVHEKRIIERLAGVQFGRVA